MFKESEHPRDKDGKFTDGSSGNEKKSAEEIEKEIFPHLTKDEKPFKISLQFFTEEAIQKQKTSSIKKGIRSLSQNVELHQKKIAHPERYDADWNNKTENQKKGLLEHWQQEIDSFQASIERRVTELKKRGEYDGT